MNGGLLAFMVSSSIDPKVKLCIAIVAAFICVLWLLIQARMGFWSLSWENKAACIEELYVADINKERQQNKLPPLPKIFIDRKPKNRIKGEKRWPGMSTRKAGVYLPFLFLLAWIVFFSVTIWDIKTSRASPVGSVQQQVLPNTTSLEIAIPCLLKMRILNNI